MIRLNRLKKSRILHIFRKNKLLSKKSAFQISVNAITILIIAIIFLSLGLLLIKSLFGESAIKFEEQLSKEPDPQPADAASLITLSREKIISSSGETEAIKANLYNPTAKDWIFRDAVILENEDELFCGKNNDGICYLNPANLVCDSIDDDKDCKIGDTHYTCYRNSRLGEGEGCVIVAGWNSNRKFGEDNALCNLGDNTCDCGFDTVGEKGAVRIGNDPDCDPTEGIRLSIDCSEGLSLEKIVPPKEVASGSSNQFSALLNIGKKAQKGTYLCSIGIKGYVEDPERFTKELRIEVT